MRLLNLASTAVAKAAALFILIVGLLYLVNIEKMISLQQRLGEITFGQDSFQGSLGFAIMFSLGCSAIAIVTGVIGLLRWRMPAR